MTLSTRDIAFTNQEPAVSYPRPTRLSEVVPLPRSIRPSLAPARARSRRRPYAEQARKMTDHEAAQWLVVFLSPSKGKSLERSVRYIREEFSKEPIPVDYSNGRTQESTYVAEE